MYKKTLSFSHLKRFSPYLIHFKKEIGLALVLGIINGLSVVFMTFYIGKAVDTLLGKGQVNFQALFQIMALLLGITLTTSVSQWLIQTLGNKVAYFSVADLRKDAFKQLNKLPLSYYDTHSHGDLMSRFSNDLDYVSDACTAIFNQLFSGVTIVVISLVSMVLLSPMLTLVVLISTFFIFLVNWLVATNSQKRFSAQQKIVGDISGFLSETVTNQKIIKSFQYETNTQESFNTFNTELQQAGQKAQFISSLTNPLSRFVDHLGYLAIGLVGGLLAISNPGVITIGIITSFILYASQFSKPFIEISGMTTQIQTALAGLERVFQLMDEPIEKPTVALEQADFSSGQVTFQNVTFSYKKEQPLIQDFSLFVNPGETIAIVGKTGAGKSTLVNLLMRFYEVDSGDILIDGISIRHISRDTLRQSFGMVLQETWLFNGTIWDNLTFGKPDASLEEVVKACHDASIYHFIRTLPEGFQTKIGHGGLMISDGQKQLLTIARTMISQPKMLILDEATSSVDTLTEQSIQEAFFKMMEGKTSFVIAHRLSTIKKADKILVMEQGKIVEIGTHAALLAKPEGAYRTLYQAQYKH